MRPSPGSSPDSGCVAAGAILALSGSPETGVALFVLGAGDCLDVSPAEQTYHALLVARASAADDGDPARLSAADFDDNEGRLGGLGELISARCDRVWEGSDVRSDGVRVIDLDGGSDVHGDPRHRSGGRRPVPRGLQERRAQCAHRRHRPRRPFGHRRLAASGAPDSLRRSGRLVGGVGGDPIGAGREGIGALQEDLSPRALHPRRAWIDARFAAGAGPLSIAAWFLGTEGAKRIGGRLFKRRAEAWVKEPLEGSVGLVYLHVARIYDP